MRDACKIFIIPLQQKEKRKERYLCTFYQLFKTLFAIKLQNIQFTKNQDLLFFLCKKK